MTAHAGPRPSGKDPRSEAREDQGSELLGDGAMQIAEAVGWSGIGRSRLYAAMARGELPYVQFGGRRLIPTRALRNYLAKHLESGGHGHA